MNIINKALSKYVKEMKLSSQDKYVYLLRNQFLGDVLVSMNDYSVKTVEVHDIAEGYFNKIYSVDYIKGDILGCNIPDVGVLDTIDYITIQNIVYIYQVHMKKLSALISDINVATDIRYANGLNNDEIFYNEILSKRKTDGAGRYILCGRVLYMSPSALPCTKKNDLDAVTYYSPGYPYYIVRFITHKSCDVNTYFRVMCL